MKKKKPHNDVDVLYFLQVGLASGHTWFHSQVLSAALLRQTATKLQIVVTDTLQKGRMCS